MSLVHKDVQPALDRPVARLPSSMISEESDVSLTEEEIQEAEAEGATSMLEIEDIVIEYDSDDADEPDLDMDAVGDIIVAGQSFL